MGKSFITATVFFLTLQLSAQFCGESHIDSIENIDVTSALLHFLDEPSGDVLSFEISLAGVGEAAENGVIFNAIEDSPYLLVFPEEGKAYDLFIRSNCVVQNSAWTGPYRVISPYANGSGCDLSIPIPDNSCPDQNSISIDVDLAGAPELGKDIFLKSVDLIIDHNWPPDLRASLISPAGVKIALFGNQKTGGDHFGGPNSTDCSVYTSFDVDACSSLLDDAPPYIGSYLADESLVQFNDTSGANGLWTFEICDQGELLMGTLQYLSLNFQEITCESPKRPIVTERSAEYLDIQWEEYSVCDSIIIEHGPIGFIANFEGTNGGPGGVITKIDCGEASARIAGLTADTEYDIHLYSLCSGQISKSTCVVSSSTLCGNVTLRESFEDNELCVPSCDAACPITGLFFNLDSDDFDWIVHSSSTATNGTGPNAGADNSDQYIYVESSNPSCQGASEAVLQSNCLLLNEGETACAMAFDYWMEGRDIGSLSLQISNDNGMNWNQLIEFSGAQSNAWLQHSINLDSYTGESVIFQFRASGASNGQADIAIDNIVFFGATEVDSMDQIFYLDTDGDGFGAEENSAIFCSSEVPSGYSLLSGDCNDDDETIHPNALEITCNQIDENCNGLEDDSDSTNLIVVDQLLKLPPSCIGVSNGSLAVIIIGGQEPYNYLWSTESDSNAVDDLASGYYHLTVTDAAGCQLILDSIDLIAPQLISIVVDQIISPSCLGDSSGSISVTASGANPPYDYNWSNGDTTNVINSIPAGNYMITVTDEDGCTNTSQNLRVNAPQLVRLEVTEQAPVACHGDSSGLIDINVTQGVPTFSYLWNTGEITDRIEKLHPGFYVCTVTDATGCIGITDSIEIGQNDPLELSVNTIEHVRCAESSSGKILLSLIGGEGPYSFLWSDGDTNPNRLDILAGSYDVSVTDINLCVDSILNIEVRAPSPISIDSVSIRNVTCRGTNDGEIYIELAGGNAPYQILWSTSDRDSTTIRGLAHGLYSATISDASGCKFISPDIEIIELNEPLDLSNFSIEEISCKGEDDGELTVFLDNGTAPFIYNWSIGLVDTVFSSEYTIIDLPKGIYDVTVTDNNGCVGSSPMIEIEDAIPMTYDVVSIVHPSCPGDMDGSIEILIHGGTPDYVIDWNISQNTALIENLSKGVYFFDATDDNDCFLEGTFFELMDPAPITSTATTFPQNGSQANGIARLDVRGGTPPYMIQWDSTADNQTGPFATGLLSGKYFVEVTDFKGCLYDTCVFVDLINSAEDLSFDDISIYPNPVSDFLFVEWKDEISSFPLELVIVNTMGQIVKKGTLDSAIAQRVDVRQLEAGVYHLILSSPDNKVLYARKFIKL